jgi:hypothetical protein
LGGVSVEKPPGCCIEAGLCGGEFMGSCATLSQLDALVGAAFGGSITCS